MRTTAVVVLVALACVLIYLTFINRTWPGNSLVRVPLLMAVAALMGIAWVMARSKDYRRDGQG